jgi:DNA-binding NtrC family response regulator
VTHALRETDYQVVALSDFATARAALEQQPPDLLISEVKLGAYNGLHLAIVAHVRQGATRSIIIGPPDPVMEREAHRQHAVYLTTPANDAVVLEAAARVLSDQDKPATH